MIINLKERRKAMMRVRRILLFLVAFSMMTAAAVVLCSTDGVLAGETPKIIALKGEGEKTPESLTAKLGTTIVWHNEGPGPVTIKFITKIGIACAAPMNFYADLLGYYETSAVPQGGTASLCFIEEGTYEYEVKRLMGKDKEKQVEMISRGKVISVK